MYRVQQSHAHHINNLKGAFIRVLKITLYNQSLFLETVAREHQRFDGSARMINTRVRDDTLFSLSEQAAAVPTKHLSVFTRVKGRGVPKFTSSRPQRTTAKSTPMSCQSSDRSKQLILDLALSLPLARLGRLLRLYLCLALTHDRVLPCEGVRGRGVGLVV